MVDPLWERDPDLFPTPFVELAAMRANVRVKVVIVKAGRNYYSPHYMIIMPKKPMDDAGDDAPSSWVDPEPKEPKKKKQKTKK